MSVRHFPVSENPCEVVQAVFKYQPWEMFGTIRVSGVYKVISRWRQAQLSSSLDQV